MRLAAVMALLTAIAVPANAASRTASVEDLFQQFGLFGSWAPDCAAAASPENPYVSITKPDAGHVLEDQDLGPGATVNHYRMLSAKRLSAERLSVEVIFQPGQETEERERLIFRVHRGTRRTLFNQPAGGAVLVENGLARGNGHKTPLLHKCD
jgi:hypothetical protein